jgi:GNAT superfamily N-acetyltransferase
LPEWFGRPESTREYIERSGELPFIAALHGSDPLGFISILRHSEDSAEIYVMGVLPELHHQGIGRRLVEDAEIWCRNKGISFLQVKTLSEKHSSPEYARTRRFYRATGFLALEEHNELWDANNPCLQLIKYLGGSNSI